MVKVVSERWAGTKGCSGIKDASDEALSRDEIKYEKELQGIWVCNPVLEQLEYTQRKESRHRKKERATGIEEWRERERKKSQRKRKEWTSRKKKVVKVYV